MVPRLIILVCGAASLCASLTWRATLRRIAATLIRKLPFGGSLLRLLKRGYRWCKCVIWTHAPLLRSETRIALFLRLGHVLMREGDLDGAIRLLAPLAEPADASWSAANRGTLAANTMRSLHANLADLFVQQGDIDRAVRECFSVLYHQRAVSADIAAGSAFASHDAEQFAAWIEAHDLLAETVLNNRGDFDAALEIYRRKRGLQRCFGETFGLDDIRVAYLPADWVRNIGHMALIDAWVKMQHLGWRPCDRLVLLAPRHATANDAYLHCWRQHVTVVTDPRLVAGISFLAKALGNRVAGMLTLPDGRDRYFCEGVGAVQAAWEADGRPPLLELSLNDRDRGREALERLGVRRGAWFVCLHVRSPGFHNEGAAPHQTHRNAAIRSYLPAIRHIVARGGFVVRLGDSTMERLPPVPGLIDYAHSPEKSPSMDVFLCASCRFFIGVASGLSHLPTTFGVPCALTNWVSDALPVYSRSDVFIPKLLWSEEATRYLSFEESLERGIRNLGYCAVRLSERCLRPVDNSPEEIVDLVREMFEMVEGRCASTAEDNRRQGEYRDIARQCGLVGFARIGRSFLRKHARLLGRSDQSATPNSGRRYYRHGDVTPGPAACFSGG
jgi:putative glycosyltransferase (TIGR04372 family)